MSINLTQALVFETDDLKSFKLMLKTATDIMFDKPNSQYSLRHICTEVPIFWNDGAEYDHDKKENTKPTRFWLASLHNYGNDYKNIKSNVSFKDNESMVEAAMELLKDIDTEAFAKKCGDGYTDWFNHFDGDIDIGYRLHMEPMGGAWPRIIISLTHLYYGK